MKTIEHLVPLLLQEAVYQTARSSGKGGQHVNKTESKVELYWSIVRSQCLTEEQKKILQLKLKNKLSGDFVLIIKAQNERSQAQNKKRVQDKFIQLITTALKVEKTRKETQVPEWSKVQRLLNKKIKAQKIALRKINKSTDEL